jgi:DNA-binding transcriptional MerR regulator
MEKSLPPIPAKRYFTIGEVGELCDVKPHVLRYWEQEFTQLRPVKRRGNRRYYQHHEVLMIRRISDLLYAQGFTISGARNQLQESAQAQRDGRKNAQLTGSELDVMDAQDDHGVDTQSAASGVGAEVGTQPFPIHTFATPSQNGLRNELLEIRDLLSL